MVGTTVLPHQATTSAQQATSAPQQQQQQQSQQQQPQAQESHEKATQSKADETMHGDNAGHQASNPAGMPSHIAPPPMATFMANSKAETPHQSNLDKGKQNHQAPTAESAPNTPGLGPPARRQPNPIARNVNARPVNGSQRRANQRQANQRQANQRQANQRQANQRQANQRQANQRQADQQQAQPESEPEPEPEPEPIRSVNNTKRLGWGTDHVDANENYKSLGSGMSKVKNLALVKAWLERNNYLVDNLNARLQGHDFVGKTDLEKYRLLLSTGDYQGPFNQISNRYTQLRNYATVWHHSVVFDWQVDRISLEDIQKEGLKALVAKDWVFIRSLNKAFEGSLLQDAKYINIFKETVLDVGSVYRSIENITAPQHTAASTSGLLAGSGRPPSPPRHYNAASQASGPVQPYPTGPPGKEPSKGRPIGLTGTSQWG
jgi:hypothetical protein